MAHTKLDPKTPEWLSRVALGTRTPYTVNNITGSDILIGLFTVTVGIRCFMVRHDACDFA
jgi:hypothetical protein